MSNIVLANVDYQQHVTDEGDQFQRGLEHAGWMLAGAGYDQCRDVEEIIRRYSPLRVVIHDKRDWDPKSSGCFNKTVGFFKIHALARHPDIFKAVVVKDAATSVDYQHRFYRETGASAAIVYYHPRSVTSTASWLAREPLIRTYHSVDADFVQTLDLRRPRERGIVTGATSKTYPLRELAFRNTEALGIQGYGHPGYGNRGTDTPRYLEMLSGYRVHVATASRYRFALRKIIESVSVGCTPVTNLPAYEALPEIDGALVRISENASLAELRDAIDRAVRAWDLEERLHWSERALVWYDWRATGMRLSELLLAAKIKAPAPSPPSWRHVSQWRQRRPIAK